MDPFDSQPGEVASPNEDYLYDLEIIIVCKPPNRGCTLLDTWSSPYVISYDLVNLTIFCYDYKLYSSTIITFEK